MVASVQDMPLLDGHLHAVSVKEARPAGMSLYPCILSLQLCAIWIYHGDQKTAKPLTLSATSQDRFPRKTAVSPPTYPQKDTTLLRNSRHTLCSGHHTSAVFLFIALQLCGAPLKHFNILKLVFYM